MTPEYHLACAGVRKLKPKPTLAQVADQIQVQPPTLLGLLDAALARTQEPETRALLTTARALIA